MSDIVLGAMLSPGVGVLAHAASERVAAAIKAILIHPSIAGRMTLPIL
ncbi:MAG: hypothetical protein JNM47_09100 [Hyphomonadaceae bacterium]|nr:hypothetical protein [Hyphomonadaceae bacterium]